MINFKKVFKISDDRYFGLDFDEKGSFLFLVPKQLYPTNDDPLYQIKLLKMCFDILSSYIRSKEKDLFLKYNQKIEASLNMFNGMVQLINDYVEYGDFNLYNSSYKKGNKRINWSRTIEDKDVFIQDNIVIFNSFISKQKEKDFNNEFYILYKYALNNSLNVFKNKEIFNNNINFTSGKIKNIINNFEDNNFRDRGKSIIIALKNIFLNASFSNFFDEDCKTPYHEKFEHIWEFMVNSIIPENLKIKVDNAIMENFNGSYYNIDGSLICNGSKFKTDHIIIEKNNISILDSKFYNFYDDRQSKSSPYTESISKQENYKSILKTFYKNYHIHNYFIFPKNNKENRNPEYFALHKSKTSDLFLIKCIAIDIETVIKYYLSNVSYVELIYEINNSM